MNELTEKQFNIIGAPWHFNLLVPKEKAEVFAFARAAIVADHRLHRKDATALREMLRSLQAGEMTVSRARELIDMWLAGNYSDDQLPPASNYPMGEDDEPMALLVAKDAEIAELHKDAAAARRVLEDRQQELIRDNGTVDPDTGTWEGPDWVNELVEELNTLLERMPAIAPAVQPG